MKKSITLFFCLLLIGCSNSIETERSVSDLHFDELSVTWDEAMPLGNATIGALVWQRDSMLRFSIDRIDLWDLRPTSTLTSDKYNFKWLHEQWLKNNYSAVQDVLDKPYDKLPAPTKIPGAAIEFNTQSLGELDSVHLYLNNALCQINWSSGAVLKTFVHAEKPIGWFEATGVGANFLPILIAPNYGSGDASFDDADINSLNTHDLKTLGYKRGEVITTDSLISYQQQGHDGYYYDVAIRYSREGGKVTGAWSITSSLVNETAKDIVSDAFTSTNIYSDYASHNLWWRDFWQASDISVPDKLIQKQYYNDMYKFGSTAREDSYPISLQSVWTADNGTIPPWKGDYHHDLNTQLSYWPAYIGNHLNEGLGYLNTLWDQQDKHKAYTLQFFGVEGLNVPGVTTLDGEPMGGWSQYSMSPTVSAWLSHHFYLHWKYSADNDFLASRAYPYVSETAQFLENFTYIDPKTSKRRLPLSSSPEIFNNSAQAWFDQMTNYDLALVRFAFSAASEMADSLGKSNEAQKWSNLLSQMDNLDTDKDGGLTFAKGFPYNESHRHLANSMAFHPLALIDISNGEEDKRIIDATIRRFDEVGPDYWCGYSYSWIAGLKARAKDGDGAAKALQDFAEYFVLKNTFHANGDQKKAGKSTFDYRPFTLEGNFAFASALQEMMLQSHSGTVTIFPAIPSSWKDISFNKLRTFGAFLVSASMKNGKMENVYILPEKGGRIKINNTFGTNEITVHNAKAQIDSDFIILDTNKGVNVQIEIK